MLYKKKCFSYNYSTKLMLQVYITNQTPQSERRRFEQLIAQYRTRVYEVNYISLHQASAIMEEVIQSTLAKPTILVIEDNTDEWFLIRYGLLRQFPEIECVWLSEATEVLTYLDHCAQSEKDLPRLILLDLYLHSAKRGLHVLQGIKSHQLYQQIPTVVFSRSADPNDIAEVLTCSADSYVVKPNTPAEWQTQFAEFGTYWQGSTSDKETFPDPNP